MALPVVRFNKVVAGREASPDLKELASVVESNLQEIFALLSTVSTGRFRLTHTVPDDPEDGDVIITDSGGTRTIDIYNGDTATWQSATLS